MKKWVYSTLLPLLLIVMCSCGGDTYAGTWYDSSDPDGRVLDLYEDGKFSYGDIIGSYPVEEGTVLLEPTHAMYGSETLTISTHNGERCLVDGDGDVFFVSYDLTCEYKNEMGVAEAEQYSDELSIAMNNFKNYLPGTWITEKWGEDSKVVIYENGTYEDYLHGEVEITGTWSIQEDDEQSGYIKLVLIDSSGKELVERVSTDWFIDQESMEVYFIDKAGPELSKFAKYHKTY